MASAVGCTATHINARGIRMLVNPTLMPGDLVLYPVIVVKGRQPRKSREPHRTLETEALRDLLRIRSQAQRG